MSVSASRKLNLCNRHRSVGACVPETRSGRRSAKSCHSSPGKQTYGQAAVPPSAANVLYSFQPVWNAALAALVLGEQLDAAEVAGGALIIAGAILAAEAQQQQGGEE